MATAIEKLKALAAESGVQVTITGPPPMNEIVLLPGLRPKSTRDVDQ